MTSLSDIYWEECVNLDRPRHRRRDGCNGRTRECNHRLHLWPLAQVSSRRNRHWKRRWHV